MSTQQLRSMLDQLEDTREVVVAASGADRIRQIDALFAVWSVADAEAHIAYESWCAERSGDAYSVYRAAQDRADAAQDALAAGVVGARL